MDWCHELIPGGDGLPIEAAAYGIAAPGKSFAPLMIQRRDPGDRDIVIDIAYAGICHSDIHTVHGDWGTPRYPLVPGHEIAGVVSRVGADVTRFQVGDRAGVGCFVDSCRVCEPCRMGADNHCVNGRTATYNAVDRQGQLTYGGYASTIVVDERYALTIPWGLGLDEAAPLPCAGVTVYAPLRRFGAGPGMKIAVIGLGGVGHMAVKIANALGAEVTVLSQTLNKMEDGLRLGARNYVTTTDDRTFTLLRGRFHLILNTVSAPMDLAPFFELLRVEGTFVQLAVAEKPYLLNPGPLLRGWRSFTGSMIGSIALTQEMLQFCAQHQLGAEIEHIGPTQIDEAYRRVMASDVRYRFVIDTSELAGT